jgi:hypothetical protein
MLLLTGLASPISLKTFVSGARTLPATNTAPLSPNDDYKVLCAAQMQGNNATES